MIIEDGGGGSPGPQGPQGPPGPTAPAAMVRYVDAGQAGATQDGSAVFPYATIQQAITDMEAAAVAGQPKRGRIYLQGPITLGVGDTIQLTTLLLEIVGLERGSILAPGQDAIANSPLTPAANHIILAVDTQLRLNKVDLFALDIIGLTGSGTALNIEDCSASGCNISNLGSINIVGGSLAGPVAGGGRCTIDVGGLNLHSGSIFQCDVQLAGGIIMTRASIFNCDVTFGAGLTIFSLVYGGESSLTLSSDSQLYMQNCWTFGGLTQFSIVNSGLVEMATTRIFDAMTYTHNAGATLRVDSFSNYFLNGAAGTVTVTADILTAVGAPFVNMTFSYGTITFGAEFAHSEGGI